MLAAVAVGCAKEGVRAAEPQEIAKIPPAEVKGPIVQAGTDFPMTMLTSVGTQWSTAGQPFTARVERALTSPDGTTVVRAGAIVEGTVARVDSGTSPVLALSFDTIETRFGEAPISAKLEGAERVTFPGTDEIYDPYAVVAYDALFYPPAAVYYPAGYHYPAYVGYFDYYDENAREIGAAHSILPFMARLLFARRPMLTTCRHAAGGPATPTLHGVRWMTGNISSVPTPRDETRRERPARSGMRCRVRLRPAAVPVWRAIEPERDSRPSDACAACSDTHGIPAPRSHGEALRSTSR